MERKYIQQWVVSTTITSSNTITVYFPIAFNTFLAGNATINGGNWTSNRGGGVDANKASGFVYPENPSELQAIAIGI